jgi:hypothetical protein
MALTLVTVGCDDGSIKLAPSEPAAVSARAVVGSAAAALDGAGRFALHIQQEPNEISEARAREQADGWIATFGRHRLPSLGRERGVPIEQATLRACSRAYRAESPFLAPANIKPSLRRAAGPQWLVPLCEPSGRQAVLLAVSAYNTDVAVVEGRLVLPPLQGSQFKSHSIPMNVDGLPISPEAAANLAYEHTGIAVAEVPRLELPPFHIHAYAARWKIVLERPAALISPQGQAVQTREIWIGPSSEAKSASIAYAGGALEPIKLVYTDVPTSQSRLGETKEATFSPRTGSVHWVTIALDGGRKP